MVPVAGILLTLVWVGMELRTLPFGTGIVMLRAARPIVTTLRAWIGRRDKVQLRADRAELETLIRGAVWGKWSGHRINHADFVQPARSMSMIGG